jgi:hypothetical protein
VMADPEETVVDWLATIAGHEGLHASELTIATHSVTASRSHITLIGRMRDMGVRVVVPEPVTIEPPYLLSLLGLGSPRIDAFVGVIGLSEIAFAALLLDLVLPEYRIVFRLASIDGARAAKRDNLGAHFTFAQHELEEYAAADLDVDVAHSSAEIVPAGAGYVAALFAVTDNEALGLPAPVANDGAVTVTGLVIGQGARLARVWVAFPATAEV